MNAKVMILAGALLAGSIGLFAPGGTVPFDTARNAGTKTAITKTASKLLAKDNGRHAWCIKSSGGNSDNINFTLGSTASTTIGMILAPGDSFCDPVGGPGPVYTGDVYAAAITTAATVNVYTLSY